MEDDTEILDWGHEEEEDLAGSEQRSFAADDAEDAVSLGGDEEDEFLTYQSHVPQGATHRGHSPPKNAQQTMVRQEAAKSYAEAHRPSQLQHQQEQQMERANSGTPQKHKNTTNSSASEQSPLLSRTHSLGKLIHALPPKPVVSSVPFVHPSHPSIIEATAMASRSERDKRNGAGSKPVIHDTSDPLPPGWEVKYPRSGRGVYYYNIHTQECTWTLPTSAATRVQRSQRSDHREDSIEKSLPSKSDETLISRVGRSDGDMSYDDRHYRPGDDGRREDRLTTSIHLITGDTYIPDTYVPGQRNGRSSPAPSRTRDSDLGPPPRRPISPAGSYGDSMQSSYREVPAVSTLSAEDRTWVARDIIPVERPREHRERDLDSAPSDHECRSLPRDTDRSSTLRPKSPVSYSRDSQGSVTTLHTSSKSAQANFEAPPKQKSRFSQADVPVQSDHRQSDTCDSGTRQARTDDVVPFSSHHRNDDIPSRRSLSDARGASDIAKPSASDAQRSESRKRTPLPPQSEAFRPGSRLGTLQRDSGYGLSGVIVPPQASAPSPREIRSGHRAAPGDGPRNTTRHTPSPTVPQADLPTAERGDGARSRRFKPSANGPMHTDSYFPPESTRGRDRDVAMDVDDAPPPRSPDPPPRHSLPKRPVTQDEVPRYPRAMLGADGDGTSRGITTGREARETKELKPGSSQDEPSRSDLARGRQQEERHAPVNSGITQKEPTHHTVEPKAPPAAPNIRLSGTNNIPIGTRNRFPPVLASGDGYQDANVMFGNNAGPVDTRSGRTGKDYERPVSFFVVFLMRTRAYFKVHSSTVMFLAVSRLQQVSLGNVSMPALLLLRALPTADLGGQVGLLGRPLRSTLGTTKGTLKSRFGPPIVKESTEPTHPQRNVSSESLRADLLPEDVSRATAPPLSRESSMASIRGTAELSGLPAHLPSPVVMMTQTWSHHHDKDHSPPRTRGVP
ncbi:hypothetical protein PAXRUDRAFT_195341 [Paxillus rubicundulus Ve08.2h10]|uniref:WW domain-containing protein n=1 Tax=Paxillus rubicundulus Ve08.2h10 TaxID=930991 RepID=A0A0D0DQ31_9AGAM|nr:hypothetical protein PAXRUDRAFT_195341 [Paxillus rubicundulus Ve08.2h10]